MLQWTSDPWTNSKNLEQFEDYKMTIPTIEDKKSSEEVYVKPNESIYQDEVAAYTDGTGREIHRVRQLHSSPKEVHIDSPQFSRWPRVTNPDLGSCQFCQMVLTAICKRPHSQDQLTKLKWPKVGVSDLGTSENWGGFHVHFFRRRV